MLTFLTDYSQLARDWLWQPDSTERSRFEHSLLLAARMLYAVVRDLRDGQLSLRAMSLVYTTLIAIVPLLALSFSVLKGFGLHHRVEPALLDAMVPLGDQRFEIVSRVLAFVDNVKVGVLGTVGFALLIYSVIAMMHKIERSFNYTWQVNRDRTMSQRFRDYLSAIFVGPLMIFLSVGITTSTSTAEAIEFIQSLPLGADLVGLVNVFIPYLIMALGFAFIYLFLPNTHVRPGAALIGGLVTAVIWKVMGWGIATFVANSSNNLAIYSAFASIIVLMVWMYVGWLVLLVGASVAFYFQNPQYALIRRDSVLLDGEAREKLAVAIMQSVYENYHSGAEPWHIDSLSRRLQLVPHLVDDMIAFLVRQQLLVEAGEESQLLYPAKPAAQLTVEQVLRAVRTLDNHGEPQPGIRIMSEIAELFGMIDRSRSEALQDITFAELLDRTAVPESQVSTGDQP